MNMRIALACALSGAVVLGCSADEQKAASAEPAVQEEVTVPAPKLSKEEIAKRRAEFKARVEARKKARAEALKKADKDPSAHPTHAAPGGLRREVEDLKSEVKALRAEIEALKAKTGKEQGK